MDDLYPNSGETFDFTDQPEERTEAEREEERKAKVDKTIIKEAIEHFETRIALNANVRSYGITEETPQVEIKAIMLAHTMLDELLESEKSELETLQRSFS